MTNAISTASDAIADFNPQLAEVFRDQPFQRVNAAKAFAAGFAKNPEDDIHPVAALVLEIALFDRAMRALAS